jgi:predicted RNA-binding protein YlqC (UPF0109 family)
VAPRFRDFVVHVAQALSEQPERVQVEQVPTAESGGVSLRLVLAPEDVGRIVGRRGRTAKSIRTLLRAAGDCELEIVGTGQESEEDGDSDTLD